MVKKQNVVKTNGGSKILSRRGYDNKPHNLGPLSFPSVRMRFLSKSSQDSHGRGVRRYEGLNNNILLEAITFNNNNNNHSGPNATGRIFTMSGSISVRASSPTLWGELSYKELSV